MRGQVGQRDENKVTDGDLQNLFLLHLKTLWRFIHRMSPSPADAEDILQDVALVVLAHRTGPPDAECFVPWCCGVARKIAAHKFRSETRRRRHAEQANLGQGPSPIATGGDPESHAIMREELEVCLDQLNPTAISLLRDRFVLEETSEEIAARLNVSSACIRMRVARLTAVLHVRGTPGRSTDGAP